LIASLLLAVAGLPALADMVIELKDGSVIRLPVQPEDLRSVTFDDGTAAEGAGAADTQAEAAPAAVQPAATPSAAIASGEMLTPLLPPATKSSGATPIRVGPGRAYQVPSQAAKAARNGDIVEIEAADYSGDVAVWKQNNLTIRGVGGRPHIDAGGNSAGGKAIWVIRGNNVTIENVELSGCTVPDRNGAGLRLEGTNFTLRNSYIHDNEMGILAGTDSKSRILIEGSEFARNTVDYEATGSLGHNVYIGKVRSFTLRGSYVHNASIGHNVKSRAANTYIIANRIMDGPEGNSSYLIDLSEGGNAYVLGNLLHKSATADNFAMIAYATEGGKKKADADLFVVNNTAVSDLSEAVLLRNQGSAVATVANNIFVGGQSVSEGPSRLSANLTGRDAGLVDAEGYDFRLSADSPAIDAGDGSIAAEGGLLIPDLQYVAPTGVEPRPRDGAVDVGAFEAAAK